jgi:hypothetical protein
MKERKSKKPSKTATFLPLLLMVVISFGLLLSFKKNHTGNGPFSAILLHHFQLMFPITSVKLN